MDEMQNRRTKLPAMLSCYRRQKLNQNQQFIYRRTVYPDPGSFTKSLTRKKRNKRFHHEPLTTPEVDDPGDGSSDGIKVAGLNAG